MRLGHGNCPVASHMQCILHPLPKLAGLSNSASASSFSVSLIELKERNVVLVNILTLVCDLLGFAYYSLQAIVDLVLGVGINVHQHLFLAICI